MPKTSHTNLQTSEFDINYDLDKTISVSRNLRDDELPKHRHIKKPLVTRHLSFQEKNKQQKITQLVLSIIGFIFLFLCLIRVPYFGVFFDNVFFSFFAGWTKYLIYFFLFAWIIISYFKKPYLTFFRFRYILLYFTISFLIGLILSGIGAYVLKWPSASFGEIFWNKDTAYITNWYEQLWVRDLHLYQSEHLSYASIIVPNKVGYGGLIATLVIACFIWGSPALIIIFSILIIAGLIIYVFWRKDIKSVIKLIGMKLNKKFGWFANTDFEDHSLENNEDEMLANEPFIRDFSKKPKPVVQDKQSDIPAIAAASSSATAVISEPKPNVVENDHVLQNGVLDNDVVYIHPDEHLDEYIKPQDAVNNDHQNGVLVNPELNENGLVFDSATLNKASEFHELTKPELSKVAYLDYLSQKINPQLAPIIAEIEYDSFDPYEEYQSFSNTMIDRLEKYFRTQGYDFYFFKKEIEFQTVNIIFKFEGDEQLNIIREIINNNQRISDWLDGANLKIKALDQQTILFVIRFKEIASISLKDVLNDIGYHHPYVLGLGKYMNRDGLILDTIEKPNQLVYGNKAPSGRIMQISQMILSAAFLNVYKFWQFYLFDTTKSFATSLKGLKHVVDYESEVFQIVQSLKRLKNDIEVEKQLLQASGASNIYEYNSLVSESKIIPNRFIVINDVASLYDEDAISFHQLLSYLLTNAKEHGLNVLISSEKILDDLNQFYEDINTIICFNVNTPNESVLAINSLDAAYLNSYGDALALIDKKLIHFQATYGPKNVIVKMVELINEKQSNF